MKKPHPPRVSHPSVSKLVCAASKVTVPNCRRFTFIQFNGSDIDSFVLQVFCNHNENLSLPGICKEGWKIIMILSDSSSILFIDKVSMHAVYLMNSRNSLNILQARKKKAAKKSPSLLMDKTKPSGVSYSFPLKSGFNFFSSSSKI